jgi:TonB family protein
MAEFLIYDLKVAVLIAAFYFCYRLLMERETMHRLNRIVLLSSILLSFILPLCVITLHKTVEVESPQVEASAGMPIQVENQPEQVITELGTISAEESVTPSVEAIVFVIFIIGLISRVLFIANSYRHLRRMIKNSEQHSLEDGVTLAVVDLPVAPFSWMRTIVLSRIDYEERNPSIIAHERGHILLHHSWDIVFVEVLTALQWFNPVVWLLRRDLRTVHEYEADASVLSSGSDVGQYIQLLMLKATGTKACILANGINNSTIKKRIIMMLKHKSNRWQWLRLAYLLPIVGITIALNAETLTDYVYNEPQQPVKKGKVNSTFKINDKDAIKVIKSEEANQAKDEKPFQIDGRVGDKNTGEPIVGAVIRIVGSTKGTVSDKDGRFKLTVKRGDNVEAAYVGYETQTLPVRDYNEIGYHFCFDLVKESTNEENKIYDVVEQMPQYPGGKDKLMQYLAMSIRYPKEAEMAGIQGRVISSFIVEKDGSLTGARIEKSVDKSLDAEALRIINEMPKWTPGMQNGEPVRVKYLVPITFRILGTEVKDDGTSLDKKNVISEVHVMGKDYKASSFSEDTEFYVDDKLVDATIFKTIDPKTIDHMDVLKKKPGQKAQIRIYTKK